MADSHLNPATCRGARALLHWSREKLATVSGLGVKCVRNYETYASIPHPQNRRLLIETFLRAGVTFGANGVTWTDKRYGKAILPKRSH